MRLIAFAFALAAFAPRAAWAVEGGTEDRTTTFSVAIAAGGPSSPALRCTGTLIAPNVVLTVRHCVVAIAPGAEGCTQSFALPLGTPTDLWVAATPWADASSLWKNVTRWVLPEQTTVCGNDIALLVLDSPFAPNEATPATPTLTDADFRTAIRARTLGIAGFGATSAAGSGQGKRHSRFDIPVRCVPGDTSFACEGALDYIDIREFTAGAGPCTGDSGAGAISATDHDRVLGVLSRGNLQTGTCTEGVFERTDAWGWLLAKTVLESAAPGVIPPAWARAAFVDAPSEGAWCRGEGSCADAADACVSFDDRRSFTCAQRCTQSFTCKAGTHCESSVCTPNGPVSSRPAPASGCALCQRTTNDDHAVLGVILAVLGVLRRRATDLRDRAVEASEP